MATIRLDKEPKEYAYRSFVDDQVLTATQLNEIIDYFECQDRLSRVCLDGVGIACGMQVTYQENTQIDVSKGCAVTTDGDLIAFDGKAYTHAKRFDDDDAKYARFSGIPLIELFNADEAADNGATLLNTVVDLDEKVVLLYLENFAKDETLCTSTDCDSQGQEQVANVRMLLIDKDDVPKIASETKDPIFDKHNNTKKYINLPEIDVKRVILKNSYIKNSAGETVISLSSNTANYFRLKDEYKRAIKNTTVLTLLKDGILKLYNDFRTLLDIDSLPVNDTNTITLRLNSLFNIKTNNIPIDIQYRYDLLKDLVVTYNEIKCLLFDLRVECCPDKTSFPKHLLLGELEPDEVYLQCRHNFYPSPIHQHGKEKLEEIRMLIRRLHFMLTEYRIPVSSFTDIKVTPSNDYTRVLSDRSIPYYYQTTNNLIENWNYDKTKKFEADENLGYQIANLSSRDAVQNPLDYNIDDHDFYRIEGHLGKDYRTALNDLDAIKTEKGLAFDIKALSIDETLDSINIEDYECEFEDLNAVLKAWRAEQNCLHAGVSRFFSGFSLANQGQHKFYTLTAQQATLSLLGRSDSTNTGNTGSTAARSSSISNLLSPTTDRLSSGLRINTNIIEASLGTMGRLPLTYNVDTVVIDNLETDEDVLGNIVEKAMKEKPEGSAEDITHIVKTQIDQNEEIGTWDADIRKVSIEQPYEILAYTKVATRFIPNNVVEMSPARINDYKLTVSTLCDRVEAYKKNMTRLLFNANTEVSYQRIGYEQQYALLLNQLSINCCAAKKMEVLLEEIQKRKLKILEKKLLSKFVEKHPGLEHKAGVKPGGTFIMVYKGKARPIRPFGNLLLAQPALSTLSVANTNLLSSNFVANTRLSAGTGLTAATENISINPAIGPQVNPNLNLAALPDRNDLTIFNPNVFDNLSDLFAQPIANVSENTVVADFALPYTCCSDCSPVAFIVPKQPISLRLPVSFICLDDETEPIAFEVEPADGIVTADVDEGINGGVVQIDGRFHFDASLVDESLYGEEIEFKVNDQITNAKITVYRKPDFDFTMSDPRYAGDIAVVNFTVQGDELPEGVSYLWDFGDDTLPDNRNEENPRHEYKIPVNEENTVTVTLTITNGRCRETIEHELTFISLQLEENTTCLGEEPITVTFEVTPSDATVDLVTAVPGVTVNNTDGQIEIAPSFTNFGNAMEFTVNGESTSDTLTVNPMPSAQFTANQVGSELVLSNSSENANDYIWNVNGQIFRRSTRSQLRFELTPNSPTTWTISLEARSETCGVDVDGPRTVTVEIEVPPADTCIPDGIERIKEEFELFNAIDIGETELAFPFKQRTVELYTGSTGDSEIPFGVLNDPEAYLSGSDATNNRLEEEFSQVIRDTQAVLLEVLGDDSHLIHILEAQLRLLYRVLCCQDEERLSTSGDIKVLLEVILNVMRSFNNPDNNIFIPFTDQFKEFIAEYRAKIEGQGKETLENHFAIMDEQNLLP